jgi:hypothetical protein
MFCRPETTWPEGYQNLVFDWERGGLLSGRLYKDAEPEIGFVFWYANLRKNGAVSAYSINVASDKGFWCLEIGYPELQLRDEDSFKEYLIGTELSQCIRQAGNRISAEDSLKRVLSGAERLARDSSGSIAAYESNLKGSGHVIAKVDSNLRISAIEVNGKEDKLWEEQYKRSCTKKSRSAGKKEDWPKEFVELFDNGAD